MMTFVGAFDDFDIHSSTVVVFPFGLCRKEATFMMNALDHLLPLV